MANLRNHCAVITLLTGVLLRAGVAQAGDATLKCQQYKLMAQGRLELCLKRNSAKVLADQPDKSALCRTRFEAALSRAEQIAVAAGTTACRYINSGDGTVSDLNTGLQWEQKDQSGGIHDWNNRYSWCVGPDNCADSSNPPDGTAFTQFLFKLNGGLSADPESTTGCFAGHCDWRLPTIEELAGIVDPMHGKCAPVGEGGPCIDPIFGPTQPWVYWSQTTNAPPGYTGWAWDVNFYLGAIARGAKTANTVYVRAVRGGL